MHKLLLLFYVCFVAGITCCFGQVETDLNRASNFAVLASTQITNNGNTSVTGNLGISPGDALVDNGSLEVLGRTVLPPQPAAANAMQDARAVYNALAGRNGQPLGGTLGNQAQVIKPGIYNISGNANLSRIFPLDAEGDLNATFVFIIEGDLTSNLNAGILTLNGAQARNIYWIVKGKTRLAESGLLQGTLLSLGDVVLENSVSVIGRVVSLEGSITLNTNNVFLPTVILANLSVTKEVVQDDYYVEEQITYNITARNAGPGAATRVVVREDLPAGLEFISATPTKGAYDQATGEWSIASLNANESATLQLICKITAPGTIVNKVTIEAENPDPDPTNDTGEVSVEATYFVPEAPGGIIGNPGSGTGGGGNNGGGTLNICAGEEYTFEVPVVDRATGYTWTIPTGNGWEILSNETERTTNRIRVRIGTVSGNVSVTADYRGQSSNPTTISVAVTNIPATPGAIDGDADVCEGDIITYTVTAETGAEYEWVIPTTAGWRIVSNEEERKTNAIRVEIGAAAGEISVRASNGCGTSQVSTVEVAVTNKLTAPQITPATTATACVGTQLTFSVPEIAGASGYSWSIPDGWDVVGAPDTRTITLIVGEEAGEVEATITNKCGSVTATLAVTPIALPAAPAAPTITGDDVICANSNANTYTATGVTGDVTYEWVTTGGLAIVSGQGTNSVVVSGGASGGSLSVRAITTTCEVSGASTTKTISTTTAPDAPVAITGNTADLCEGDEIEYSVAAVDRASSYTWTVPTGNGWAILSDETERTTSTIRVKIGSVAGTISVIANNACGSSSAATAAIAVVNKPAAPIITPATATTGCVGSQLTFSIPAVNGATAYTWTLPATWTPVGDITGSSITVTVGETGGNIAVAVSNQCGVGAEGTIAVAPVAAPAAPVAILVPQICTNSTGNVISVAAVPGATGYTWAVTGGLAIISGQGTNSITVSATTTGGQISVTASGACNTTSPATTANVAVTAPPVVGDITDNSSVCNGLTYAVNAVAGATSYTWTVSPGFTITAGQGTTSITVQRSNNATTTGTVSVVASNGNCAGEVAATKAINVSLADGQLAFPKAFSPNGDSQNDLWVIQNLEKYTENEITIFNSWGSEVYKRRNYRNDWNAAGLGEGTYYYRARVKLCDGVTKEFTGYVTVFR
ncbi:ice-binding family protein [Pontibacter sp. SGAir0037]|uniref:ice-binding family protein n=1 Tax=Pontibacter sp. SGAir0037 TaxID=2571030 RepID=UPI0010CCD1D2|nr:ice-binding family protein [Pontibacter sp. SGAir0037]QCR23860.1 hypothetical protein C1N53_16910 [Pontibacter sp. SGAir0037]